MPKGSKNPKYAIIFEKTPLSISLHPNKTNSNSPIDVSIEEVTFLFFFSTSASVRFVPYLGILKDTEFEKVLICWFFSKLKLKKLPN